MSLRFGDKTRAGEAVTGFGQRASSGGSAGTTVYREEVFLAPGTWTKPSTATVVDLLVVGGGGGAGASIAAGASGGGGGGGRVRYEYGVPVTAPVPVTVGAGGTGGLPTPVNATEGGTSGFGPLGPGPVPTIPPTTVAAGGGGFGANSINTAPNNGGNAPPIGGGGGGGTQNPGGSPSTQGTPGLGTFGYPGAFGVGTPVVLGGQGGGATSASSIATWPTGILWVGQGLDGYGGGGYGMASYNNFINAYDGVIKPTSASFPAGPTAAKANSGAGGSTWYQFSGGAGGSGIVIVRWWE